jgi:hypothetical protein
LASEFRHGRAAAARRVGGWALAALLLTPALGLIVWLANNWRDAPVAERPAALMPPAPRFGAARAGHDGLVALKVGTTGQRLADPVGAPWFCAPAGADCSAAWLAQPAALARQRQAIAWGARCDALVDADFAFDERLPPPLAQPAAWTPQHLSGAVACARWFHTGAALAFAAGDTEGLQRELSRADRLNRALLGGSRSLIAVQLALRSAHGLLDLVGALALRGGAAGPDAEALAAVVAGWPAQETLVRQWVVHEAAHGAAVLDRVFEDCADGRNLLPASVTANMTAAARIEAAMSAWLCRHRIGIQPQRTLQYMDSGWLDWLGQLDREGLAALAAPPARPAAGWHWRNTFGAQMVDIGLDARHQYIQRHLDLALHRRLVLLVLAIERESIEPRARAGWLARQPLEAGERARFEVRDGGFTIAARSHGGGSSVPLGERAAFVAAWPR